MLKAILRRMRESNQGTFGLLRVIGADGKELNLATGELPWRDNARGVSCIPVGTYRAYQSHSPKFRRELYELANVPGRSQILIHHGNYCGDVSKGFKSNVEGCILVGVSHGTIGTQQAVLQSLEALRRLHEFTKGVPLEVTIA